MDMDLESGPMASPIRLDVRSPMTPRVIRVDNTKEARTKTTTGAGAHGWFWNPSLRRHNVFNPYLTGKQNFESMDYDIAEEKMTHERSGYTVSIAIGFATGVVSWALGHLVHELTTHKLKAVLVLIEADETGKGLLTLLAWIFPMALAASIFVWIDPAAAGSGIPLVKTFLNGNYPKDEKPLRVDTLFYKMFGVGLSVSCGFPAGREGPMVQAGAIVASQLAQGLSVDRNNHKRLNLDNYEAALEKQEQVGEKWLWLRKWFGDGNAKDHLDFVAMGAAAGVSSAFNAPIGGVLFALEEVASYWSTELTWHCFICSCTSSATLSVLNKLDDPKTSVGSTKFTASEGDITYQVWELGFVIILAAIVGMLGALFVYLNTQMTVWRLQFRAWMRNTCGLNVSRGVRALEATLTIVLIGVCFLMLPLGFGCRDKTALGAAIEMKEVSTVQLHCNASQYSELGTMFLNPQEGTIIQLFSRGTAGYFTPLFPLFFGGVYLLVVSYAYGIGVPAGLFIPCMTAGAAFGRCFGEMLANNLDASHGIEPGLYGLVGAAAMLGGSMRMTISLTVILLELTNDITLALPVVVSLAVAKAVGDLFTESIYIVHCELDGVPYLEPEIPPLFSELKAEHAMTARTSLGGTGLHVLPLLCTPAALLQQLKDTDHNTYPVVLSDRDGDPDAWDFQGVINRRSLFKVLRISGGHKALSPKAVDLTPHLDAVPYVVQQSLSLRRAYQLVVKMGVSYLPVLDGQGRLAGVISRADLVNLPTGHDRDRNQDLDITGLITRSRKENEGFSEGFSDVAAPPAHAKHEKVSAALTNWGEQGRAGTTAVAHDTAAAQTPTKAHDDKPVASPTNNLLASWGEGEQEQGPPA